MKYLILLANLYFTTTLLGQGATIYYVKAPSASPIWNDTRNWNPQRLPNADDIVEIGNGHTVTLSTISPTVKSLTIRAQANLIVDDASTNLDIIDAPSDGLIVEFSGHLDIKAGTVSILNPEERGTYLNGNGSTITIEDQGTLRMSLFKEEGLLFTDDVVLTNHGELIIHQNLTSNAPYSLSGLAGTLTNTGIMTISTCQSASTTEMLHIDAGVIYEDTGETDISDKDCN